MAVCQHDRMRFAALLAFGAASSLTSSLIAAPGASPREDLVATVARGSRPEIERVISTLRRIGSPRESLLGIARLMESGSPRSRENAAYVLLFVPEPFLADTLIRATRDEDEIIRERACTALGKIRSGDAVKPLVAALNDASPVVRREAARALGRIGDPSAARKIVALLDDFNPDTRVAAILALGQLRQPMAERKLLPLLKNPSETVRLAAAKSLTALGNSEGRKILDGLLLSRDASERCDGIKLIEDVKAPWAMDVLLGLTRDKDKLVAIAAARALANQGDGRGVEWLVHASHRVDPEVKVEIETALEDLGLTEGDRKKILARKPSPDLVLPSLLEGP